MSYDKAEWHYDAKDFPADSARENGGTHIAMYLTWAIGAGLVGDLHLQESRQALDQLARREISPWEFLENMCDERFSDQDLNDTGNDFTHCYYDKKTAFSKTHGSYFDDYANVLEQLNCEPYRFENTWENFDLLKPILDRCFCQWLEWIWADPANQPAGFKARLKVKILAIYSKIGPLLSARGFTPTKKPLANWPRRSSSFPPLSSWQKTASDKDTTFIVTLAASPAESLNPEYIYLDIFLSVTSKKLKKWSDQTPENKNPDFDFPGETIGIEWLVDATGHRGYTMTGSVEWLDDGGWAMTGGARADESMRRIEQALDQNLLPFMEILGDRPRALEYLAQHGWNFPQFPYPAYPGQPLAFMLCFGTREQASRFLANFSHQYPGTGYSMIEKSGMAKIATNHGLILPEDFA